MRRLFLVPLASIAALAVLVAPAAAKPQKPAPVQFKCGKGLKKVKRTVTRHGKKRVIYRCIKKPKPIAPVTPTPAPAPTPTAPVGKSPSLTTLGATYTELPPEHLSTSNVEFKIGQYSLAAAVTPFAVPTFACGGVAGCVEPAGSAANGPLVVPVQARLEYDKSLNRIWSVGAVPLGGKPKYLSLAEAASGSNFFQATSTLDSSLFEGSSARAPIALSQPHLPGSPRREGEADGPVGTELASFVTIGTYKKVGGPEYDLVVESTESLSKNSSISGCKFQTRINGIPPEGGGEWESGYHESVFPGRTATVWTIQVWARHEGAPAPCGLSAQDTYVVTEKLHP